MLFYTVSFSSTLKHLQAETFALFEKRPQSYFIVTSFLVFLKLFKSLTKLKMLAFLSQIGLTNYLVCFCTFFLKIKFVLFLR